MTVSVLMSTYNGEKYLSQQIDSIIRQKDADVELTVRDDGSSDNTTDILNKYQNENKLKWYKGDNLKPARSFMQLLKDSGNAQFYAFSDQDDYWMPDKLQAALSKIKDYDNVPALYFCQTQPADKDLHSLQRVSINPLLTFGESLVYEFVGGCTIVINRKLRDIVNSYTPEYIPMHDVWIYTIAQAVGAKIEFDSEPHILYRQHETNVIGQGNSAMHEMKRRMQRLMNKEHSRYRRALEIKKGFYGLMTEENKHILDAFINAKVNLMKRITLVFDRRFNCSDKKTKRIFNLATILNTY